MVGDSIESHYPVGSVSIVNFEHVIANWVKLIFDYLTDRLQKTKVGSLFRAYLGIIYGYRKDLYLSLCCPT